MRHYVWFAAVLAAGCGGGSALDDEYPTEQPSSTDTQFTVDPSIYENPHTSELGTNRTRGIAKTIDWQKTGTETGTAYCAGAAVVDQVLRDDAENFYGVRIRLKNTKSGAQAFQWRIYFFNIKGEAMLGFNHDEKEAPSWKSVHVDSLGYATVTDSCRLRGAVSFRLFVRQGGNGDGMPDGFGKRP